MLRENHSIGSAGAPRGLLPYLALLSGFASLPGFFTGVAAQPGAAPQFPDFFTASMKQLYLEIDTESVGDFVEESVGFRQGFLEDDASLSLPSAFRSNHVP